MQCASSSYTPCMTRTTCLAGCPRGRKGHAPHPLSMGTRLPGRWSQGYRSRSGDHACHVAMSATPNTGVHVKESHQNQVCTLLRCTVAKSRVSRAMSRAMTRNVPDTKDALHGRTEKDTCKCTQTHTDTITQTTNNRTHALWLRLPHLARPFPEYVGQGRLRCMLALRSHQLGRSRCVNQTASARSSWPIRCMESPACVTQGCREPLLATGGHKCIPSSPIALVSLPGPRGPVRSGADLTCPYLFVRQQRSARGPHDRTRNPLSPRDADPQHFPCFQPAAIRPSGAPARAVRRHGAEAEA